MSRTTPSASMLASIALLFCACSDPGAPQTLADAGSDVLVGPDALITKDGAANDQSAERSPDGSASDVAAERAADGALDTAMGDTTPRDAIQDAELDAGSTPNDGAPGPDLMVIQREPTLVLLIAHHDATQPQPDVATIQARMDTVSANFEEYSYGRMGLRGVIDPSASADVIGWLTSNSPHCFDQSEYLDLADALVDYRQYSRVVIVVANRPSCNLSAWATLDRMSYNTPDGSAFFGLVKMSSPNAGVATVTHEIAHTLRNGHGIFLNCGDESWAPSGCTSVTYGDPYDVMSTGQGHFSARRKEIMGWLKGPNRIVEITTSGDYTVEPIETNTGGVKALKLSRGLTEHPLYIEYRQPLGTDATFGANADVFRGALLHAGYALLDATPPAATYGPLPPKDAELTPALPVGETFTDPLTGNTIEVVSKSASELKLRVTFP